MRLFVLARHGQSTLNVERRVNGDPRAEVPITEQGAEEARRLGLQIGNLPFDACVHTRFDRTRATAVIALAGRAVPFVEDPLLDDVAVGDLEGESIESYRAWKLQHGRRFPFPGGESLDDAALRYAAGYRRLLESPSETILVVAHEIPVRYALNAAAGSDLLDGPIHAIANAAPYVFDENALARAVAQIERLAGT